MLRTELEPYEDGSEERVVLTGPPLELSADLAVPTGMAIHELTTNAATHGALSTPSGRVEVIWDVERDESRRMLCLEWVERDGPPVEPPSRKGFGSTLLERVLPAQCHAEVALRFDPAGLRFRMRAPLIKQRLVPPY